MKFRLADGHNFDDGDAVDVTFVWGNSRWQRVLVCWAAGGLLGFGSPSIALYREGGRPTFREAWTGIVTERATLELP